MKMKKLTALLLATLMVLSLAACGEKTAEKTGPEALDGETTQIPNPWVECSTLADGTAVTLKGDGTGFLLALWQRDGYAYSLAAETGMTAEALLTLAASAG